ncbi:MAG: hypothetical protein ACRD1Y_05325 [Terriglobales bacterium]
MKASLLLISPDEQLVRRVERALPLAPMAELRLVVAPGWPQAGIVPPPVLVLWDVNATEPQPSAAPSEAGIPVLWMGIMPLLAAGLPDNGLPGPVVDFLDRELPSSKLAFVLQQHLAAAYLRSLHRGRPGRQAPEQFHADLNNALTGLIGNAELAAELARAPHRRLPPPLAERLDCIVDLAGRVRALLESAPWPDPQTLRS